MNEIQELTSKFIDQIKSSNQPRDVLKLPEIKKLYGNIKNLPVNERASYGKSINDFRNNLEQAVLEREQELEKSDIFPIDLTAPWDVNSKSSVYLLPVENSSRHPLTVELENVINIFTRMGFEAFESRQIDDDAHMFQH